MQTSNNRPINLKVIKCELNFLPPKRDCDYVERKKNVKLPQINNFRRKSVVPVPPTTNKGKKSNVNDLIESLLEELYSNWSNSSDRYYGISCAPSLESSQYFYEEQSDVMERHYLEGFDTQELLQQENELRTKLRIIGERLGRCVRARDRYRRQQKRLCDTFSVLLRHIRQMSAILNSLRNLAGSTRGSSAGDDAARFSVTPGSGDGSGEGGYSEWLHAMRLVARLPAGVPQHFRKKLWLTLAERYLNGRGVDWSAAERACFRGSAQPDDAELGAQILKDLHRTGCSLFCGKEGRENQGMLRRVLLAYARWNKDVGYCQGFNMLAAIILEVMDKSESDSLKVMVYLVEAVLPEGYFADDLRGLSADMAAFRDLLRLRLPRLATHMDHLQKISDGGGVEPPLPDVFTMQWFLTLYATWLPRESLLRIWDLILLDGNEVLLLTALAIWDMLQDRILSARSADEYYSCMGGGAGAIWEAGDALVTRVVSFGTAPELPRLRNLHRYRVTPPVQAPPTQPPFYQPPLQSAMQTMTKKGLRLFYSEDEGDSSDDGNKMALATVVPRRDDRIGAGDRLSLDIGALKRQYARLRERQRQAHVILAAACARHAAVGVPTSPTSLAVNNLLLGKSAIVSSRGRRLGPPPGAIPPSRHTPTDQKEKLESKTPEEPSDTISWVEEKHKKSLSRRNSLKWKDIKKDNKSKNGRKPSIDFDETGDGIIVSEREADEMIATLRSRSSSESSTYSSHSGSSTDTSLCDEGASDSEPDIALDNEKHKKSQSIKKDVSPRIKTKTVEKISNPEQVKNARVSPPSSDINMYIKSPAGESLRSYISEFQNTKTKTMTGDEIDALLGKPPEIEKKQGNKIRSEVNYFYNPCFVQDESLPSPPRFYSPISENSPNVSPNRTASNIIYNSTFEGSPERRLVYHSSTDLIDSLAKYPDFVPDIDVSDKNTSDLESPLRSPDAESIVVSEDEPPIPLKIDKYFEHSPEFFGARITALNSNNPHIPTRRPAKRLVKPPRKPDSLTLYTSHNKDLIYIDSEERASSLPQYDIEHEVIKRDQINITLDRLLKDFEKSENVVLVNDLIKENLSPNTSKNVIASPIETTTYNDNVSPKDLICRLGRKNSERALQIIQENSKILNRILTKQNIPETNSIVDFKEEKTSLKLNEEASTAKFVPDKSFEVSLPESSLLKESISDSLIEYNWPSNTEEFLSDKSDFLRNRPISLDNPVSVDFMKVQNIKDHESIMKSVKSPSTDSLLNKMDHYGWENKGFVARSDLDDFLESDASLQQLKEIQETLSKTGLLTAHIDYSNINIPEQIPHSNSMESKTSITFPSTEHKETPTYDHRLTSEGYSYPLSTKYNDFVLTKASDIFSKTVGLVPKVCENLSKTDNSQVSDFAHVVTSSISFTYDPSAEDDSPIGAKSNSSDTLCQITSLDQVSTPISPKIFPRETPTNPKEFTDKSDRVRLESDDTCSAITSLLETDTISSLSYPRSPTTGSYHFPSRPPIRMPKELGVRLGMYPKDGVHSPSK